MAGRQLKIPTRLSISESTVTATCPTTPPKTKWQNAPHARSGSTKSANRLLTKSLNLPDVSGGATLALWEIFQCPLCPKAPNLQD